MERLNLAGCDALTEHDVDDDTHSTCSTVYSAGDVSQITENNSNDIACIEDIEDELIEDEDLDTNSDDVTPGESEESLNRPDYAYRSFCLICPGSTCPGPTCPGYVLIIDNVDMNIRRSNQRVDRTTQSYHYCHGYAVLNRVDSTQLADHPPSGVLSVDDVLPSKVDLESILSDFEVIISR